MKICILTKNSKLYSHQRLKEAGEKRGHEMMMLNTLHCYMNICASEPTVHYRGGKVLEQIDAVIPRIGANNTFYGTAVLRQLEVMGTYSLNDSLAIVRSRDKLRSLQLLSRKEIPMPVTGFAKSPLDTENLIELVGGAPLIIKLLESTQGEGVVLAETNKAAHSVINAFKLLNANILVQEFIKEAAGTDIRCFVIGDQAVAAMQRTAKAGEFRSNVHKGGSVDVIELTQEEKDIAVRSAQVMGLEVAGVDLIRSARGSLLLEVNSSPGLEGIERATGLDIASMMIEHIEREVSNSKHSDKAR
ncbi:MAG: 30S ribosomal protein S6--L-glutamate ligase [Gammaproteobacteria bacterium CG11_big_fil_rev_8_21_14_0_20_46_22]|nr:MAG: 30S ribosomal protein S6--L-glutamate ligase [Gammaproteobacteria bacterium CG12_big_fil_rev_8_21_14_0_65_46_12]PIR10782.1 MAG: 30S ribosomal protein S6--L-glutamate ligase [Gammaproteobacteria bacterium CG11_big_fil_rev_8_21_14_0_20_46_22]